MSGFPIRDAPASAVAALSAAAGVRPVTAQCLLARGVSSAEAVEAFVKPRLGHLRPPRGLADLDIAVERLADAIAGGEVVGVFGDYDVDGVTSAALLSSVIGALGGRAVPRVARRDAGYGFGSADVDFFVSRGCHLIVTADCGTSDLDAIAHATASSVPVIVIDHHTVPTRASEHPAYALINPFRDDSTFEFRGFASVGLAFYVMQMVRSALQGRGFFRRRPNPDLRGWLDLVAIGTIADLVPLTDENRILTAWGLLALNQRRRPGLVELLRLAGVEDDARLGAREVAWKIAPRLNAPGRLGDAEPSLALLLAKDAIEAGRCAAVLEQANQERREAQDVAYAEALAMIEADPPGACAVVAGRGWKPGVVGIVAARLVDLLERPAFVLAIDDDGVARGSARTHDGVSVYQALASCDDLLDRFGGHAAAAGLTTSADNVPALRERLGKSVGAQQAASVPTPSLADAEVTLEVLDESLIVELETLQPFGKGNPEIALVARNLEVLEARAVGADRSHLKLVLGDGRREIGAIGFGLASGAPAAGERIDVLFAPLLNRWRGSTKVEMQLVKLAPAAAQLTLEDGLEAGAGAGAGIEGRALLQ